MRKLVFYDFGPNCVIGEKESGNQKVFNLAFFEAFGTDVKDLSFKIMIFKTLKDLITL